MKPLRSAASRALDGVVLSTGVISGSSSGFSSEGVVGQATAGVEASVLVPR